MMGSKFVSPTIQTSVKFCHFDQLQLYIFISFQQITIKPGSCSNLEALFSVESVAFSITCPCQKLKEKSALKFEASLVQPDDHPVSRKLFHHSRHLYSESVFKYLR